MTAAWRALRRSALVLAVMAGSLTASAVVGAERNPALLDPKLATEQAPDTYRVKVDTTSGTFVIEVHRAWAPNGADRFYNLVKIGYFDDTAFFRVIKGFMAQVGMNGNPEIMAAWSAAPIEDDPIVKDNTRGLVTFAAKSSPNSRTTQFFVNYGDNTSLKAHGKFAPFGQVVEGMEVVDSLYAEYGEQFPKLDYIKTATIVES